MKKSLKNKNEDNFFEYNDHKEITEKISSLKSSL